MFSKVVAFVFLSIMTSCVGMKPETSDTVENTGISWNFEVYNKSKYTATVIIGNKVMGNTLNMEQLGNVAPFKKIRTVVNRSMPVAVEIQQDGKKITESYIMGCIQNRPCSKSIYLTLDDQGLRPQTGQWYGLRGITDSELDNTQNITQEQIQPNWNQFVANNRSMFREKTYARIAQDQSMYQKTKEKLNELWYGQPKEQQPVNPQQVLVKEIAKYKTLITNEADDLLSRTDSITTASFKKATARAILNKWKRESVAALEQVKSIDELKTIYDNFTIKTANTKQSIESAEEQ